MRARKLRLKRPVQQDAVVIVIDASDDPAAKDFRIPNPKWGIVFVFQGADPADSFTG